MLRCNDPVCVILAIEHVANQLVNAAFADLVTVYHPPMPTVQNSDFPLPEQHVACMPQQQYVLLEVAMFVSGFRFAVSLFLLVVACCRVSGSHSHSATVSCNGLLTVHGYKLALFCW
jgi:hypothetical protein